MDNVSVNEEISQNRLEQKNLILIELVIISIIFIITSSTIVFFILGWLSLYLRNKKWKDVGFKRPEKWSVIIVFDILIIILTAIILLTLVLPVLNILTGTKLDLSSFNALKEGDYLVLLGWLVLTWTLAAFGEEFVYRGYIQNRWVDLVGDDRNGWIIAVLITSVLFGISHAYQGIVGMLTTSMIAILYSAIYLRFKRNLWASIIAHGFYDTIAFIVLFFFGEYLGLL